VKPTRVFRFHDDCGSDARDEGRARRAAMAVLPRKPKLNTLKLCGNLIVPAESASGINSPQDADLCRFNGFPRAAFMGASH
jgi:hypothetical protein